MKPENEEKLNQIFKRAKVEKTPRVLKAFEIQLTGIFDGTFEEIIEKKRIEGLYQYLQKVARKPIPYLKAGVERGLEIPGE